MNDEHNEKNYLLAVWLIVFASFIFYIYMLSIGYEYEGKTILEII